MSAITPRIESLILTAIDNAHQPFHVDSSVDWACVVGELYACACECTTELCHPEDDDLLLQAQHEYDMAIDIVNTWAVLENGEDWMDGEY